MNFMLSGKSYGQTAARHKQDAEDASTKLDVEEKNDID